MCMLKFMMSVTSADDGLLSLRYKCLLLLWQSSQLLPLTYMGLVLKCLR